MDKKEAVRYLRGLYGKGLSFDNLKNCYRPVYGLFADILAFCRKGASVLDFGCGPGPLSFTIARTMQPKHVSGYDINPSYIEKAKRVNPFTNVDFVTSLPAGNTGFDTVIVADVLHHIIPFEEKRKALATIFSLGAEDVIIKDLDPGDKISCVFNSITDFLSTRSKVEYVAPEQISDHIPKEYEVAGIIYRRYFLWANYIMHIKKKGSR